jgi:acyl-ACP thioesterase
VNTPYKENFRVRFNEADATGLATVQTVGNWLQEAADQHARTLGWAREQLQARRLFWALTGLRLVLARYPRWRETATIATWPSGADRLFAWRDFEVTDAAGVALGAATSAWLLVNEVSRRPIRMLPEIAAAALPRPRALVHDFRVKLVPPERAEHTRRFHVRRSDLDVNGHVNNVAIIEWVVEAVPPESLGAARVTDITLEFQAEALLGDEVIAQAAADPSDGGKLFRHQLRRAGDGRVLAVARTEWSVA